MKRSQPLKRTAMKRGAALAKYKTIVYRIMERGNREAWERIEADLWAVPDKKRKPLRKVGARAKREADSLREFRAAVLENAGFACERCGASYRHYPAIFTVLEAHHKRASSQGGSNDPSNGAALCGGPDGCHAKVTDHRAEDWRDWVVQKKPRAGQP